MADEKKPVATKTIMTKKAATNKSVATKKTVSRKTAQNKPSSPKGAATKQMVGKQVAAKKKAPAAGAKRVVTNKVMPVENNSPTVAAGPSAIKRPTSAPRAKPLKTAPVNLNQPPVSAEERHRMIQEAAYYKAQKRGSAFGNPEEDWAECEQEIDEMLRQRLRT